MRRKGTRLISILLCAAIFAGTGDTAIAVNYDEQIKEEEEKQEQYEKQSEKLQKELEQIQSDKDDVMQYIEKLDKKIEEVEDELKQLRKQISQTEKKLDTAEEELSAAQENQKQQYTTMVQRIRYMYENGNQEYLEILFSADSMTDLLNRTEYIEKIADYDKKIFDRYQTITEKVEEKKQEIEKTLKELEDMKDDASVEKDALAEMRSQKKKELKNYSKTLKKKQKKAEEFARQAAEAETKVEKLLEEKQREIDLQNDMGNGNSGSGGTLRWPLNVSGRISSGFGKRSSPTAGASTDHKGLDIAVSSGTPIVAAASGTVVTSTYSSSAGNFIMISHGKRLYTVYMHCSRRVVSAGDKVNKGEVIGYVGSTGISTGSHLHFGVSKNGSYVNPLNYVKQG